MNEYKKKNEKYTHRSDTTTKAFQNRIGSVRLFANTHLIVSTYSPKIFYWSFVCCARVRSCFLFHFTRRSLLLLHLFRNFSFGGGGAVSRSRGFFRFLSNRFAQCVGVRVCLSLSLSAALSSSVSFKPTLLD